MDKGVEKEALSIAEYLKKLSYDSLNELNSVEHYIVHKLSGVNLNAADSASPVVKEDAAVY